MSKHVVVLGGAGFVGSLMAKTLKEQGHWVRVVDIKRNEYMQENDFCDEFILGDLTNPAIVSKALFCPLQKSIFESEGSFDEAFNFAARMGGIGYIGTGDNDSDIIYDSALINLYVAQFASTYKVKKLFFSSSACVYNEDLQQDPNNPGLREDMAWPLNPDSVYGIEKAAAEIIYTAFSKNKGLDVRIARFHNIFGTHSTYKDGKEKAPAALCRKVAEAKDGDEIQVWGDGQATRSFLFIDECVEAVLRLMASDCKEIVNIGSEEMISINDLAKMIIRISGKNLTIKNVSGPTGVRGRNSNNDLYKEKIGWCVSEPLEKGIIKLYHWVNEQVNG